MERLFCAVNRSPGMHLSTSDTFSKTDNLGPPVSGFPGDKPPLGGAEQAGTLEETVLFLLS